MNSAFESLAQRLVKEHWDFYPTAGSRIGRHEYDGQLPDLSPHRITRRVEELRRGLAQLSGLSGDNGNNGNVGVRGPVELRRLLDCSCGGSCSTWRRCGRWRTIPCGRWAT